MKYAFRPQISKRYGNVSKNKYNIVILYKQTNMKEPKVEVGILFEPQIEFILLTPYHTSGKEVCGKQVVTYNEGRILWNGRQYDE